LVDNVYLIYKGEKYGQPGQLLTTIG